MTWSRIAVIGGGTSDEHDVSLASAAAIGHAVTSLGAALEALTIARDGSWSDGAGAPLTPADVAARLASCDVAIPALHGTEGEDGTLAGFLTLCRVPFAGSPVRAGALAMDKWATKLVAEALGIATAQGIVADATTDADAAVDRLAAANLDPPFVVKPATGGSSNGVVIASNVTEVPDAVRQAREYGHSVLVESFIDGVEVDIALYRDRAGALRPSATLAIGVADGAVFDRDAKYDGSAPFEVPAPIDTAQREAVLEAACTLYDALECAGVARFDFFVTATGVVLNEVNTAPGMTEQSQVPRMYAHVGLDYPALVRELVDAALASVHGADAASTS